MILIGFLILIFLRSADGAACGVTTVGADPAVNIDTIETDSSYGYLATGTDFTFQCCGVIAKWELYIRRLGNVYLQVWRETGGQYQLVGQIPRSYSFSDQLNKVQVYDVPQSLRISIDNGDHLGWFHDALDMIPFRPGPVNGNYKMLMTQIPTVGDAPVTWSGTINGRVYAIRATTADSLPPRFTNLVSSKVVLDTANQAAVGTLTVTDDDPGDVDSLVITQTTETGNFWLDNSRRIRPRIWTVGIYLITYIVTDTCGNSEQLTFNFTMENTAPVISPISSSNVPEGTSSELKLKDISVTDKQSFDCYVLNTSPANGPFVVKDPLQDSNFALYATGTPSLNHALIPQYLVNVTCRDDLGLSSTTLAVVNVLENNPPTIPQLPDSVTVSAKTADPEVAIFDASATDTDSTQLSYNMTCSKTPCNFEISQAGMIKPTQSLTAVKENTYDLFIYAYDGHTLVGPNTLTVDMIDINDTPELSNLPDTVQVPENTGVGTVVFDVNVLDDDTGDTHTFTATILPSEGSSYFQINNSTGEVTVIGNIDYESLKTANKLNYEALFTVSDRRETSVSQRLILTITDVNEPQTAFTKDTCGYTSGEGAAGTVINSGGFPVDDPDLTDIQKYTMDCGADQEYFTIELLSGIISQTKEYDVDPLNQESVDVGCTVTATDLGNHTISIDCVITIEDINDNRPIFQDRQYDFTVQQCTGVGSDVGQVVATDEDVKLMNNDIVYSLSGSNYFEVRDEGNVYVSQDICNIPPKTAISMTVTATNDLAGSPYLSDTVPVTVVITEIPTTTTVVTTVANDNNNVADSPGNWLDREENLYWFIPAMILLAGMLALLCYVCLRLCRSPGFCSRLSRIFNCKDMCRNCCDKPKPKRPKSPRVKVKDPYKIDGKYEWNCWSEIDFADKKIELR